ncbi:Hypothetical predicted protein [Mytilus galloprovincialis]|uniref:Uncharacterized protein n=1 Tax=Mytilus galloprovincialis TaxID=29158 RepID=A0A8B6GHF1_MYTGA|nr:Hypothetical predicted protein [Mytilus galloprovincialis]
MHAELETFSAKQTRPFGSSGLHREKKTLSVPGPKMHAQLETVSVKRARSFSCSELHSGSWFYKLVIFCDGKMINVDSCDGKHKFTDNFERVDDIMSINQKELTRYLHSLLCQKEKKFEVLLIFSTLLKARIIKPEDWMLTVIEHRHRMACYMLLAYMTVTESRKEVVILSALKMAIKKGANNIAKSISWYIIRDLLRSSKFNIDLILDIWPAVVCKNTNCSNVTFCSTDLVIMVETKQSTEDLPMIFWNKEINIFLKQVNSKRKTK